MPCLVLNTLRWCCLQQSQVEQEEEYITNKLMKRLEQLKKEKQLLATEVCAAQRLLPADVDSSNREQYPCYGRHHAIDLTGR